MSRIGCVVIQNRPLDELRTDWELLESAGIGTIWVADHLMSFPKMGTLLEAWTTLGAMAIATTTARIGTLVTNITYRNPALLAKEAITIDHLSGGRLELGIGAAGTRRGDAVVAGIDDWPVAERADRFEEFVEAVDALLSGAPSYTGKHYRSDGFERAQWPVQDRIPLTIAAQGPRTLRVAARFGDRWNAMAGFGRTGEELFAFLRDCNAQLDDLATEFGRDPRTIARSLLVQDTGMDWWSSPDAFGDFIGTAEAMGIEEFVFYHPPYGDAAGKIDQDAFLQLIGSVTRP